MLYKVTTSTVNFPSLPELKTTERKQKTINLKWSQHYSNMMDCITEYWNDEDMYTFKGITVVSLSSTIINISQMPFSLICIIPSKQKCVKNTPADLTRHVCSHSHTSDDLKLHIHSEVMKTPEKSTILIPLVYTIWNSIKHCAPPGFWAPQTPLHNV